MTLFSQAGSLNYASHTQPPGSDLEKKMNATCGPKCVDSFGRFNRNGLWAKTFSALLIGQEGWFSKRCRLTWKVKGTKYNRMYFQLRVSKTLPTNEIGFGLLPTAQARDWKGPQGRAYKGQAMDLPAAAGLLKTPTAMDGEVTSGKKNPVSGNSGTLAQEIMSGYKPTMEKLGLLPTPESFDWNSARHPELWEKDKKKYAEKGINLHCNLRQMARLSMLPTPRNRDYKGARSTEALEASGRTATNSLPDSFSQTGKTSQLNPLFVGEMMGFPPNWLELPFQNTETNP